MDEKLYQLLLKLPKENIVNLMWEALDEMQSYNGRSRQTCIMLAMDATEVGEGKRKLPSLAEIKRSTENMGL